MTKIIRSDFQNKRKNRNSEIAKSFLKLKKQNPVAGNADCIRGICESFSVSESTVRIALKEEGVLS